MGNRFAFHLIILAVLPALAIFALSVMLFNKMQDSTANYLSIQTQASLEQVYRAQLQARSLELASTINEKLESIANETRLLAKRVQYAVESASPNLNSQSSDRVFIPTAGGAHSSKDSFDTVIALWPYLTNENGQPNQMTQRALSTYEGLDPFLSSLRQSGVKKSWSYIIGPKNTPFIYATPWANIPEAFASLYPEHSKFSFYDYFFPGLIESWQQWVVDGFPAQQITFTPIYEDAGGKGELITVFHPIWKDEATHGAVATDVNVKQLLGVVAQEKIEQRGFATIITSEGEFIGIDGHQANTLGLVDEKEAQSSGVRLRNLQLGDSYYREVANLSFSEQSTFHQLQLGEQQLYLSANKIAEINVWKNGKIAPVDYYAVFVIEQNEVMAIKDQLARRLTRNIDQSVVQATSWSVLATAIAIICALLFTLNYRRRMRNIATAAKDIAERDFGVKVSTAGNDEISYLGTQINVMGEQLSAYDELQMQANARLSQQVQERTQMFENARQEAEQANNAKSLFLANMSHEIRTPLTTVIGYADSILTGDITDLERNKAIQRIAQSGEHLLVLLNDILDISKIEAGQLTCESRIFKLVPIVKAASDYAEALASETGNRFTLDIQYPIYAELCADEVRLKQVLFNLLSNAFKFTRQGEVILRITREKQSLHFKVVDNGIGVAPDKLTNIFKPFEQSAKDINRLYGGTGLGLSISQQLVRLMGGDLNVDSELGTGSKFSFSLPFADEQGDMITSRDEFNAQLITACPTEIHHTARCTGTVLVAEDNVNNRELITTMLQRFGLTVTAVSDGVAAVEAARNNVFDLMLFDIQMPHMRGDEAIKKLRSLGVSSPALALTANVLTGEIERYLASGFIGYLAKPIDRSKLIEALSKHLTNVEAVIDDNLLQNELAELKARFMASLTDESAQLMGYYQSKNVEGIVDLCHRLRGAASNYQEDDLVRLCFKIEHQLTEDNFEANSDAIERLMELLNQLGVVR